jgi:type I restriction enzyme S subunit
MSVSKLFGDCAELVRSTINPEDAKNIPYIGLEHIAEGSLQLLGHGYAEDVTSLKSEFKAGDILFGKLRPYFRKVVRPKFDGVCSTDIWVARSKPGIDQGFLYYWMASWDFVNGVMRASEGTKMPRAKWDFAERITGFVPDINKQRAIAHILGTLDDKIELNRRMNQTLEEMAKALFKSWFVYFDPVRAKMEGRWKKGQSLPGMPAETWDLWPDGFEKSELGLVPKGWKIFKVEDLSTKIGMGPFGSNILVSSFVENGIPIISGKHLNSTMLEDSSFNFITQEHSDKLASSNVSRGDIVFTHAGNIGQVAYIPDHSHYERYVLSQRQFYLRCDASKISPIFFTYFFLLPNGQHLLLANASQVGVPSIARPVSYLKSIKLAYPSKALSDLFDKITRNYHHKMAITLKEIETLANLRDLLLPQLLSGVLGVQEAWKYLENK